MPNVRLECDDCGAVYNVKHDNDSDYYALEYCPFCGENVADDNQDDINEDYDE